MKFMNFNTVVMGCFISLLGTLTGSAVGILCRKPSKKFLSTILGFSGGLMMAVVVFDLIPEAIKTFGFNSTIVFCILGIALIAIIDNKMNLGRDKKGLKVAIMTAIALSIHNFPEGVIMGCGFAIGGTLGLKMSLIIALHDIPEGLAVASPLMISKTSPMKIMIYSLITALPTMFGAIIGVCFGNFQAKVLGASLAVASGIMLYVVCGEMLPESTKTWDGASSTIGVLSGILLGLVIVTIL